MEVTATETVGQVVNDTAHQAENLVTMGGFDGAMIALAILAVAAVVVFVLAKRLKKRKM